MYCVGVQPFAVHAEKDRRAFYLTVAQLITVGACRPCEIVRSCGVSKRSVLRAVQRYGAGGAATFFAARKTRRGGTVLTAPVLTQAQQLLDEGVEKAEVATRLKVSSDTVRKALADGRLVRRQRPTAVDKSARSVEDAAAAVGMGTACTRIAERVLAQGHESGEGRAEYPHLRSLLGANQASRLNG